MRGGQRDDSALPPVISSFSSDPLRQPFLRPCSARPNSSGPFSGPVLPHHSSDLFSGPVRPPFLRSLQRPWPASVSRETWATLPTGSKSSQAMPMRHHTRPMQILRCETREHSAISIGPPPDQPVSTGEIKTLYRTRLASNPRQARREKRLCRLRAPAAFAAPTAPHGMGLSTPNFSGPVNRTTLTQNKTSI